MRAMLVVAIVILGVLGILYATYGRVSYFSEVVEVGDWNAGLCQPVGVIWQDRDVTIVRKQNGAWLRVYRNLRPVTFHYQERCMQEVASSLGIPYRQSGR